MSRKDELSPKRTPYNPMPARAYWLLRPCVAMLTRDHHSPRDTATLSDKFYVSPRTLLHLFDFWFRHRLTWFCVLTFACNVESNFIFFYCDNNVGFNSNWQTKTITDIGKCLTVLVLSIDSISFLSVFNWYHI